MMTKKVYRWMAQGPNCLQERSKALKGSGRWSTVPATISFALSKRPIDLSKNPYWFIYLTLRKILFLTKYIIPDHQMIHLRLFKTPECIFGTIDNWLVPHIKARIDHQSTTRQFPERWQQLMEQRIAALVHGLYPGWIVDMRDRRYIASQKI